MEGGFTFEKQKDVIEIKDRKYNKKPENNFLNNYYLKGNL
jgi:hypothetical protein